ncbi:DUF2383 domain-containing protein [Antarcticirhabdus aurantiaca]|uniref:DUF2383 domain-containing protein n=1 Tax=Antarcticirhabdus aurantiaca TaxID=2606717 RepID=A0ACD4NUA9_9HYPH|nr:DUF2383 domain-containing protein [Antarcticirhabdus aurantiaca]WAJ30328.1 DUF2383 domain-containing protein [Jeongeuplla avenae]
MVTTVGTESTFEKMVENLLYLEHDAIAAYDKTIDKLDDPVAKQKIAEFKGDHERHVAELTRMAGALGVTPPTQGDAKQMLTTGKISLASLVGDRTVLKAMATNEIETKMAYDQAARNDAAPPEAQGFFRQAFADEDRHKAWMDSAAAA